MTRAARGQTQLIDVACKIMQERPASIAVADGTMEMHEGRERLKWFWLPRSQIEIDKQPDGSAIVTMPEWLTIEKGLV